MLSLSFLGAFAAPAPAAAVTEVKFPDDAPVFNVQRYGAKGDGVTDDTQAFKNAINAALSASGRYGAQNIIYVPNGIYKITDTLKSAVTNTTTWHGFRSGLFLQGESQAGTILRLPSATPGYTTAATPKAVLLTGSEHGGFPADFPAGEGNEAFRHYIRNLTVEVGADNPGAVGIDFLVNNRGGIFNVTVKSLDANRVGHTGIKMDRQWPGPGLIKNVTVVGFERGISMDNHAQFGMTFEKITLQNQRGYGLYVGTNTAVIRGLTSTNSVPVLHLNSSRAHAVLLDGVFTGGASSVSAITSSGKLYARNVKSTGYGMVIQDNGANNRDVAGGSATVTVAEYKSFGEHKEFADSIPGAIHLQVRDTPEFNTTDLTQWINVKSKGSTEEDALGAIQRAIDENLPIVYLPQGSYYVSNTIVLRGSIRKLIGLGAYIGKTSDFPDGAPLFRFDGGGPDFTVLQNLRVNGDVQHNSIKTLVIANSDIEGTYTNTSKGTGNLYLEDVIGPSPLNITTPQRVWARQLNIEFHGDETTNHITNNKGQLWILGYKTEGEHGSLLVNNGGWVELLGGFFYPNSGQGTAPMIINNDGSLSLTYKKDDLTSNNYPIHVRDIRGTVTSDFTAAEAPSGNNCALYSSAKTKYSAAAAFISTVLSAEDEQPLSSSVQEQ
ncbi:glycoside hydrolase family 55 protein [Hyalangium gracile]|uniref:glycoside hydrolase family 55 protein n=1 Tax=Hyalangium gracile TaxID=394092 RepID=UPI001CCDED4F|nr:glycoside hydrolase family 55 protein [Hyalangium gracile]